MNIITDIEIALQLAPQVISLVQSLQKLLGGNKASTQTVAMAAVTSHPSITEGTKAVLTSVVDNALKVS